MGCSVMDGWIDGAPDDGWSYHQKHVEQFTEI